MVQVVLQPDFHFDKDICTELGVKHHPQDVFLAADEWKQLKDEKACVVETIGVTLTEDPCLEHFHQKKCGYRGKTIDLKKEQNIEAANAAAKNNSIFNFDFVWALSFASFLCNFRVLLGLAVFLTCLNPSSATQIIKSQQRLPPACYHLLGDYGGDCPSFQHLDFDMRYKELNKTCCLAYPGKDVVCQMDYHPSGEQFSMIACVKTVLVPDGHSGRFMSYNTTDPVFRTTKLEESLLGEGDRFSWQVTYPYGTVEKSKCTGLGQEILHEGGDGEDNVCTCAEGFEPVGEGCDKGFSDEEPCYCTEMKCPEGSHPKRYLQQGGNQFKCEPDPKPVRKHTPRSHSDLSTTTNRITPYSKPDTPNNKSTAGDEKGLGWHVLWAVCAFGIVCILIPLMIWVAPRLIKYTKAEDKIPLNSTASDVELGLNNPSSFE